MGEFGVSDYGRHDVLRIFGIGERQLRLWERNGLIACADRYNFQDLGQLRKLCELRERRLSVGSIRDAVSAMRSVSGLPEPLAAAVVELRSAGARRLTFRHSGTVVEPIAGQYLLDFSGDGKRSVAPITRPVLSPREREGEALRLFAQAVRDEEVGKTEEAIAGYEAVRAPQPCHAAAAINLGTIFYTRRSYGRAEQFYRMATESDPDYALAFFDLGNVLDELKRMNDAIAAYRRAIAIEPGYADAHYNLALALERHGQRRSALLHWTAYLRLDASGPWAAHARRQRRKTLAGIGMELFQGGSKGGRASTDRPHAVGHLKWVT